MLTYNCEKQKIKGAKEKKIMHWHLFVLEAVFPWKVLSAKDN